MNAPVMPVLAPLPSPPPINWRRNLFVLCLSQFLSITAFNFCLPIAPLYIRELNLVPEDRIYFWVGIFMGSANVALMVFAPVWGVMGDRYGRKMMLMRANLAGAFVIFLMGSVASLEALIVLRVFQGAFTGTTPAAQSLASATVPPQRQGHALGLLVAALNAGSMSGQFLGGVVAAELSAPNTFRIGGVLLFLSFVAVAVGVEERFTPPARPAPAPRGPRRRRWNPFRESYWRLAVPVLVLVALNAFTASFDAPVLALHIRRLYLAGAEAATDAHVYRMTGFVNGTAALAAVLGALWMGRLLDRSLARGKAMAAAVGAALMEIGLSLAAVLWVFGGLRAGMAFCNGALGTMFAVWLGRASPAHARSAVFGWSVTARGAGWAAAPVAAGIMAGRVDGHFGEAARWGAPAVFLTAGLLYLAHLPFVWRWSRRYPPPPASKAPSVRIHSGPVAAQEPK